MLGAPSALEDESMKMMGLLLAAFAMISGAAALATPKEPPLLVE